MDLTNIHFDIDPLGIGNYQAPSNHTPQSDYRHPIPNNHFYYYDKGSESSKWWGTILTWGLGIGVIILGIILYNMPDKEIEKTLLLSQKEKWDLDYLEAKKKVKKAKFKDGVGWVIYK